MRCNGCQAFSALNVKSQKIIMNFENIKGFAELEKTLSEFPQKLFKSAMRRALYAGAKVIATEAKLLCPVAPPGGTAAVKYGATQGELRRSIRIGTRTDKATGTVSGYVKAGASDKNLAPYYARWVEYGTTAHLIKVSDQDRPTRMTRNGLKAYSMKTINKMVVRGSLSIGGNFVGPVVAHPGATPKPFMRPALDTKRGAALEAIRASLQASIEKKLNESP